MHRQNKFHHLQGCPFLCSENKWNNERNRLTKSVNNNAIYSAFVHRRNKLHHLQGYLYQTSVLVYKK